MLDLFFCAYTTHFASLLSSVCEKDLTEVVVAIYTLSLILILTLYNAGTTSITLIITLPE